MATLYSLSFLLGITFIAVANFGYRSASAPPIGSGPFALPWRSRDRYTSLGFKLHMTGIVLWGMAAVLACFRFI